MFISKLNAHCSLLTAPAPKPARLPQMPRRASSGFRVGVGPGDGALVAGQHARAAFDAVFELEVHEPLVVFRVAFCRAHVRCAVVRTLRVADGGVDQNVRRGFAPALVAKADEPQALCDIESVHNDLAALTPSLSISQYVEWDFIDS